jgi:quercetin dioxygenase-like cupin family protein
MKRRLWSISTAVAVALALGACGNDDAGKGDDHGGHTHEEVTTVNGIVPPGRVTKTMESKSMISTLDGQGNEIHAVRSVRAFGTRSPIHMHEHGGITCVVEGEMTLYLEGAEPQRALPGDCYFMPPGKVMSGVNTGRTDAVMDDIFTIPEGTDIWKVVEAGQQDTQDEFDEKLAVVRR